MNILRSFTETVVTTPTDTFPISFEYDEKYDAVHVFLNDVAVEDLGYTVSQVNAVTLKVEPAIPEGTVRIERETDIDKMKYIFDAGALFIDQNVDADFKQIVHSQQEVRDGFIKLRGDVLPLVHGLQEALQQAQEASEAAQEAADAAEEAAQVARSADKIIDSSGLTQQDINDRLAITYPTAVGLVGKPNLKDADVIYVQSYSNIFDGGDGYYRVSADTTTVADGAYVIRINPNLIATMLNTTGSVDVARFGAVMNADVGPFIEKAFKYFRDVCLTKPYKLNTVVGIPNQNNYSKNVYYLRGLGDPEITVDCPSAVFTSASAKLDPTSTVNKFTAKIDVSNISFIGTTVANSVVFNGDRLYNINVHHNNFKGNITIFKAYVKREVGRQYTQSVSINHNHLTGVYRVIESDKSYNLDFSYNMCEACIGGIYVGVDAPWDPNNISLTIHRNLWEGSGMLLKTNGGIIGGTISANYFENNTFNDAGIEKCLISINRTGTGAGYASGLVISGNTFSGNGAIPDFVDVRYVNQSTESSSTSKTANVKPVVFIGNWSNSYLMTNFAGALLINNRCSNRNTMFNAYSPQEGRVTFASGYLDKPLSSMLSGNLLNLITLDTRPCFTAGYINTNFKTTFDVNVLFKTSGGINTASCSFKLDVFVYTPLGAGTPPKSNLKAVMSAFMQSDTNDIISTGVNETMKSVIGATPTMAVVNNGDGTYGIRLSPFTNASSPNWGAITSARIEYTYQGTLIASHTSTYSTANLLTIT
ncbi:tailspike protein [Acinetobacter phage vB_AbaP_B1]|uniref:Tailspike protein n=1 Tax=Acinetobacter phage vB_AbaP_B1 TaxID=2016049 RepID=A0A221SBH9_9CAUD|nr:tail fiber protein [Acinetobacter phage vB_AbaP_B1]ASN73353.1 tailspike protein [Acinetobacter phage vB_AbaP_B1]